MNIKMQCCGIILLLIILYYYICRKKMNLNTTKAFTRVYWITLISLTLDMLSVVMLTYHDSIPSLLLTIVCKAYISSLVLTAFSAFLYILTDIYKESVKYQKYFRLGALMTFLAILLIFIFPIHMSWDSPQRIYTYGPSVITTYFFALAFLVWILALLICRKRRINPVRRDAMRIWLILWLGAALIQFCYNELLVVGFASSIAIIIIYIKLENPEYFIDRETGLFNGEAMMLYIDQLCQSGRDFCAYELIFPSPLCVHSYEKDNSMMQCEMVDFLSRVEDAYAFRNKEDEAVLVFSDHASAEKFVSILKKVFSFGRGETLSFPDNLVLGFMPEGRIVGGGEDAVRLFDFARTNGRHYQVDDTVLIDRKMFDDMKEEATIEKLIEEALEQDRVEVFYQPIYATKEGRFTSAEALVRIRDQEGRLVPPGAFIQIAEKNGSILQLGEAVFEQVCRFLKEKQPQQYGLEYIEVNLSVVQCACEDLAEKYIDIMEKYQISPRQINLEITESASVRQKKILLDNMKRLMDFGVKFSLDDFGTGQSNLNYIVEMPVSIVKFDRDMIVSYFENGKAKYVMDAAMHMIQGMELQIVSEGIETREQFQTMEELGISYIQGFYFSKPLPEDEFICFIDKNRSV